jgi:nitrogen fixation/metabolism regulation signal transduction histidine kinase
LVVKLFANPLVLRALLLLVAAGCAFLFAIFLMRRLRRNMVAEADLGGAAPTLEAFPVHLYNTVIQQLKQQKHELQVQTLTEQRRARTTENFSQTVLSNLASGVLVFGLNGLVRQANPAAKEILGFRSLSGMSAEDIFRDAAGCSPDSSGAYSDGLWNLQVRLVEELHAVLHEGSKRRQLEADYTTPAGEKLHLAVTVSAVPAVDGSLLGVACLIIDRSEFEQIRRQQQLHGELSAEMALELRTSLTTIAGYAQQLARNRDPDLASQLAADIAGEAAGLDRRIGGFLAKKRNAADAGTRVNAATLSKSER